jgi:hypothetical protein
MVMSILWKLVVDSPEQSRFLVSLMSPVLNPCLTTVFSLDYSTLGYSHPASVGGRGRVDASPMGLLHWLHSGSPHSTREAGYDHRSATTLSTYSHLRLAPSCSLTDCPLRVPKAPHRQQCRGARLTCRYLLFPEGCWKYPPRQLLKRDIKALRQLRRGSDGGVVCAWSTARPLGADVGMTTRGLRFTVTGCMLADGRVGNGRDRSSRVSMASSSSPRVGCSCLYLAFL